MSQKGLKQFGAYAKARELLDYFVVDMEKLQREPRCYLLIDQQVGREVWVR
jgi:hypothetical protein